MMTMHCPLVIAGKQKGLSWNYYAEDGWCIQKLCREDEIQALHHVSYLRGQSEFDL
jgi:hypothetical protein